MTYQPKYAERTRSAAAAAAVALLGLSIAVPAAFAAGPPSIVSEGVSKITESSVQLQGTINPNGRKTEYRFEYVDQVSFETSGFAFAASTPEGELPASTVDTPVVASVGNLGPGIAYRFRLLAKNSLGKTEGAVGAFTTYATPIGGLPDRRAYEQVTPVNKDGGDVTGHSDLVKASPGGNAVTFLSSTGVPGAEGAQSLALYLAKRGDDWSTQGLLPNANAGYQARVVGWVPDFSETFGIATRLDNPAGTALLARSSEGGQLTPIVDYGVGNGYDFVGSTADGSEVVFESDADLGTTPAGIEGASNVYAWDAVSEELSLVSVLNNGEPPSKKGSLAGSYDWALGTNKSTLGEGGAARHYYTQDEHVVGAEGSVYFTTAGSGQLYVRRNPTMTQSPLDGEGRCSDPALACTIKISVSERTEGTGVGGTDAGGAAPATFMAASADGSSALFTSSEMLTNDANTGPEQGAPAIVRADVTDGKTGKTNFLLQAAIGMAVDGTYIYWANPVAGTIGRATLDGNEISPNFIEGAGTPRYVAVDENHIYWTNAAGGEDGEGTIGRANINGAPASVELEFIAGKIEIGGQPTDAVSNPQGIVVNGSEIYWANAGATNPTRAIGAAGIGGDPASVDPQCIALPTGNDVPEGLALTASHLYWTEDAPTVPATYVSAAKLDCSEEKGEFVFTGAGADLRGIAVDAGHVYWVAQKNGVIGRAKLDLSGVEKEFAVVDGNVTGLAVDGSHLYWSANGEISPNPGRDLYRYQTGSGLSDLAVDSTDPNGVDVQGVLGASDDASYAYFVANGVPDGIGNSPNARGEIATEGDCKGSLSSISGNCNLYLWHEKEGVKEISFIARLDAGGGFLSGDAIDWVPTPSGVFPVSVQRTARVAADGRTLLFRSQRQLSDYDNKGEVEFYRYRADEAGPTCVSCNPTGLPPVGASRLGSITPAVIRPNSPASLLSRNLADNGDRVFFETPDALVASDTNGVGGCPIVGSEAQGFDACQDVYEWEAKGAGSCESDAAGGGCLYLLSSGKSAYPSFFADSSLSGEDAFLFTRDGLVGQDEDELLDVYDARVGGGISSQEKPRPVVCGSVEACHGPAGAPPAAQSPGSESFSGPADRGPVRHRQKHHKRRKHRHGQRPRQTQAKGRAGR